MLTLAVWFLAAAAPALAQGDKPKLAVLDLTPGAGVDVQVTGPLGQAITSEVARRGFFQVISQQDIATMLGLERQKQLLGCSDASASCLTELSGALGARFVLSGTVSRLGDAYQLTLNTLDTQKAQPLGRATRLAKDLETLQATLPYAVAEATATPSPAPPSRVLPYTLIGTGAATGIVGLVLGVIALNAQSTLQGELDSGENRAGVLDTHARYVSQVSDLNRNKIISVVCLAAGVVLAVTGVLLMPKDVGATSVAFVPLESGGAFALGGVFP